MALTATAAPETQKNIFQSLGLFNPEIIMTSLNRPNIFYSVQVMKGYRVRSGIFTYNCLCTLLIYCVD